MNEMNEKSNSNEPTAPLKRPDGKPRTFKVINKHHALNGYTGNLDTILNGEITLYVLRFSSGAVCGFNWYEIMEVENPGYSLEQKYELAIGALKNIYRWDIKFGSSEAQRVLRLLNEIEE